MVEAQTRNHAEETRYITRCRNYSTPLRVGEVRPWALATPPRRKFNHRRMNRSDWKPGQDPGRSHPGGTTELLRWTQKLEKKSRSQDRTQPFGKRTYPSDIPCTIPPALRGNGHTPRLFPWTILLCIWTPCRYIGLQDELLAWLSKGRLALLMQSEVLRTTDKINFDVYFLKPYITTAASFSTALWLSQYNIDLATTFVTRNTVSQIYMQATKWCKSQKKTGIILLLPTPYPSHFSSSTILSPITSPPPQLECVGTL